MHKDSDATKLHNFKKRHENLIEKEGFLVAVISEDMFTKEIVRSQSLN